MKPPTCFYMLAMFRLVFRIRVDMLNFLVKRPDHGVRAFPYCKTLKLFIRFLLSIGISGDSASDFLDMKMLIGSVTYFKQHL